MELDTPLPPREAPLVVSTVRLFDGRKPPQTTTPEPDAGLMKPENE